MEKKTIFECRTCRKNEMLTQINTNIMSSRKEAYDY